MKQTKLRRRRVVRYAILYFVLFVVFMALLIAPAIVGRWIDIKTMFKNPGDLMYLIQPTGLNNNDTSASITGSCVRGDGGKCPDGPGGGGADSTGSSAASTDAALRMMAF